MPVVAKKKVSGINKANAMEYVARRRALGRMGGRPKGVLNPRTIAKIKSAEAFVAALTPKLGQVADDLLINSKLGDTKASDIILDRTIGPVRKDVHLTGDFSIKSLHMVALQPIEGQVIASPDTSPQVVAAQSIVPLVE